MEERDQTHNASTAVPAESVDYCLLFESVPDPCLVLDRDLRIVAVNNAYLQVTMTRCGEILGRGIFNVFPDNPADSSATGVRNLRLSLERVLKTRTQDVMAVQKYDIPRPESEGGGFEVRYWSPINSPVLGADGTLLYIIHRVQDVTAFVQSSSGMGADQELQRQQMDAYNRNHEVSEINVRLKEANEELERKSGELQVLNTKLEQEASARVAAQEALNALNADLQRSNRDLELFASVTSHDLQEPLHTITSYTELLAQKYRDRLDEKAERYMGFIIDGTSRMHAMINDLLAYSRVGTRANPFSGVDLNTVLERVCANLRSSFEESGAAIETDRLPHVHGDDAQLVLLFQNLLSNSVKFRKKEVPLVICVSSRRNGGEWLFGVHDNGIGIEERFFGQIFEIFRRLHTREEYEGTGIGLAICKKIVEHHGGRIWVESSFGKGTSIYFTLPMKGDGDDG